MGWPSGGVQGKRVKLREGVVNVKKRVVLMEFKRDSLALWQRLAVKFQGADW